MRALVTGGAGFIGHHLVRRLVERGDEVRVLDDFSTGRRERLAGLDGRVEVVEGTILDPAALDRATDGTRVVFHLAALASVARSVSEPRLTNDINVSGTIEVVEAAARAGSQRVVYASSSAVYGTTAQPPSREDHYAEPVSPYGASKLAGEHYLHAVGEARGVATVALRFFNVFGPGQDPASEYAAVIPRFLTAVLGGRQPIINGDGGISRDFIHVDNVVTANLLAADEGAPARLTCNIASGIETTLLDLLEAIAAASGAEVEPAFGPPRPGDIRHSRADVTRAEEALGYRVAVPFDEGIARTVAAFSS
jgi:UDP-glucose 4-epimerase